MTKPAPKCQMMDLKISERTALLAPPTISFQYLVLQKNVSLGIKYDPRGFLPKTHWIRSRSDLFREMSAPAKKSAQIISRQYPRDLSVPSIIPATSSALSTTGS